jgi:hypothetical protein
MCVPLYGAGDEQVGDHHDGTDARGKVIVPRHWPFDWSDVVAVECGGAGRGHRVARYTP